MSLTDIAQTSQGPMVGDYISSSFATGQVVTTFAVGAPHSGAAYDEAMYSPGRLAVATVAQAVNAATSAGVRVTVNGLGAGETHHALRRD
jgi:hypothetical protein